MAANKKLKVKLVRGTNKKLPNHKACVQGLGLRHIRHTVIIEDNPCNRGMINRVSYLLHVEEVK